MTALRPSEIHADVQSTTFPPFHTSLMATLRLPFAAVDAPHAVDRPVSPSGHVAHVHAFVSLYPLHPCPPNQPSALPALPSLLKPDHSGRAPMLITLYPSGSVLVQPDSFASQVLTNNHRLLGQNLAVSTPARIVSLYVGHLNLPPLHAMLANAHLMIYRLTFKDKWKHASAYDKLFVLKDEAISRLSQLYAGVTGRLGYGAAAKEYKHFERQFLRILKRGRKSTYAVGQYPSLPFILSHISPTLLGPLLRVLPTMPGPSGPLFASVQGLPTRPASLGSVASSVTSASASASASAGRRGRPAPPMTATESASSSDHESGEDLGSSLHSLRTTSSRAESSESGTGMDESWAHLDSAP